MTVAAAILAGIGCSLCNGISTVQQKVGADDVSKVRSFDLTFLLRMLKNGPYVLGTLLAIIGYGLSLIALRVLPLFLVQSLIAASVVVTALGEYYFLHRRIGPPTYLSLAIVILGLVLLSVGAVPGPATVHSHFTKTFIEFSPLPLAALGILFVYLRNDLSTVGLAALGGLLFGNTSTIGRILVYPHTLWRLVENPLVYSLAFSAIMGQYLFIVSLQRTLVTKSNAIMVSTQTLGPAFCGLFFFDDRIRAGFQIFVLLGCLMVIIGSATTVVDTPSPATI